MDCEDKVHLLERMLLDTRAEPTYLPLSLLKTITNDFSEDQEIGSAGFAVVYKGLLQNGSTVAVKRLSQAAVIDEKNFNQEIRGLIGAKHENIVRFLGYCADTQGIVAKHERQMIVGEVRERLLCFEFMPNGCLDKYISDASEGLDWKTRYWIIKGICNGLHYLHQLRIVHLDLKPANILLNHSMVPKITDFGISKCFDEKQTRAITLNLYGSQGYVAPEFYDGEITFMSDIYSLGKIIIEMLTGRKGYPKIESVLKSWNARFKESQEGTWLEHVRVCAEIGKECIDHDPANRPTIQRILDRLDEMERMNGFIETGIGTSSATHVLEVHPLEVRFPFEPNKRIECPVTLINRTDHHVAVWITPSFPGSLYLWGPCRRYYPYLDEQPTLCRGLTPHSSRVVYVTMMEQEHPPLEADIGMFEVLMFSTDWNYKAFQELEGKYCTEKKTEWAELLEGVKDAEVCHRVTLRAVTCDLSRHQEEVAIDQLVQPIPAEFGDVVTSIDDVHPIETWILVGNWDGSVFVWNYLTQEKVMELSVTSRWIRSTKFIAAEQWFAVGDDSGFLHVYSYTTKDKVKEFKASEYDYQKLAVHPTDTLLLTMSKRYERSYECVIKLWDWSKGWACTGVFKNNQVVEHLAFGPRDTNTFASSGGGVKIWDFNSSNPIAFKHGTVEYHDFYTDSHGHHFLVTTNDAFDHFHGENANIWDYLQIDDKPIHTLHMGDHYLDMVACHPTLPLFAIIAKRESSEENHILLWDARTYRFLEKVELPLEDYIVRMAFVGTEELIRLVVASSKGIILILKINFPTLKMGLPTAGVN